MRRKVDPSRIVRGVKFYSVEDLAKILELTPGAVRDYLRKAKIGALKIGLRWWVSEKSLSNFLMCKGIRNLPDSEMLNMINKAVGIKYQEWTKRSIPLIQKVVEDFLVEKEKEKFNKNIKKVEEKNKQLMMIIPKKAMKDLKRRETEIKKEFEKVK